MFSTLIFVTCNPAPATHFAALGPAVSSKYVVSYVATGSGLGKLKDQNVQAIDFNPEKLDLSQEEVQIKIAQEMAKTCSIAKIIILDIGHIFSVHLQKAVVAYTKMTRDEAPLFIAYYENSENWVPGGYSKTAAQVISVCQAVLFANFNLTNKTLYQDQDVITDLTSISRFGIGYSPLIEEAEKVLQERLDRDQYKKVRCDFFRTHSIEDTKQKILVYLGENNTTYFEHALPAFLDFIEKGSATSAFFANTIILFQQHPNAKLKNEEHRLLIEKNFAYKPHIPKCIISNFPTNKALVLADAVLGRQSSTVYQAALADIPYMQVAHEVYSDIAIRSGYPSATSVSTFIETLQHLLSSSIEAQPERKKKVLEGLGIQPNWTENFEMGLQTIVSNQ